MVERVAFARGDGAMDDFYLPEELVEWLGLKKSEYLSKLIENLEPDDFQFHEYLSFEEFIPVTLATPDWSAESVEDGQVIKTYCRSFNDGRFFHQVVVGVVVSDQNQEDVFVPIISLVTKKDKLVGIFGAGKVTRPALN